MLCCIDPCSNREVGSRSKVMWWGKISVGRDSSTADSQYT